MESKTVTEVLKIYNFLSCGKADDDKYKETLFFKSVTEDTDILINILNGESPEKAMKIDTATPKPSAPTSTPGKPATPAPTSGKPATSKSNKFGFFEGEKKVYELFGHALRRIVDTYGSEFSFNEEDMFIHDDEKIEERDYQTITTFFNLRTGTKYDQNQLNQEISAKEIYLHFYAKKFKTFPAIIDEARKLKDTEKEWALKEPIIFNYNEICKKVETSKPTIKNDKEALKKAIKEKNDALKKCDEQFNTDIKNAQDRYATACKNALDRLNNEMQAAVTKRDNAKNNIDRQESEQTKKVEAAVEKLSNFASQFTEYKPYEKK